MTFLQTQKIQPHLLLTYPYVEIKWLDIEGDAGWSSTKDLKNQKLPDALNTLIDNRFSTSTALNTYAKASDLTSITTKVNTKYLTRS